MMIVMIIADPAGVSFFGAMGRCYGRRGEMGDGRWEAGRVGRGERGEWEERDSRDVRVCISVLHVAVEIINTQLRGEVGGGGGGGRGRVT